VVEYGLVSFISRRNLIKKKLKEIDELEQQKKKFCKLKCKKNSVKGRVVEYSLSPLFWRKRKPSKDCVASNCNSPTVLNLNDELNDEENYVNEIRESKENYNCCKMGPQFKIKASRLDNTSRFLFPAAFFTFQLLYWIIYLRIYFSLYYI
jgi:hypothetical protein